MQGAEYINERVNSPNWIEKAIKKKNIKRYDYSDFHNIQKVGTGTLGEVYRANWKNSYQCVALKSFFKFDDTTIKEIAQEVIHVFSYSCTIYIFMAYTVLLIILV